LKICLGSAPQRRARMVGVKHPPADPFDIFDADGAPELAVAPALGRPAASLHPLVRSFVDEHLLAVGVALRGRGDERLAALLESSAQAATAMSASQCKTHAAEASELGWDALQRSGAWPADAWREAFVLAQLLLCWSDAEADELPSALRRLDIALIVGRELAQLVPWAHQSCASKIATRIEDADASRPRRGVGCGWSRGSPAVVIEACVPSTCSSWSSMMAMQSCNPSGWTSSCRQACPPRRYARSSSGRPHRGPPRVPTFTIAKSARVGHRGHTAHRRGSRPAQQARLLLLPDVESSRFHAVL